MSYMTKHGEQVDPATLTGSASDALTEDLCEVMRVVMREADRDLDDRVRLLDALLDLAARAGLVAGASA